MVEFTPKNQQNRTKTMKLKAEPLMPSRNASLFVAMFARAYRPVR